MGRFWTPNSSIFQRSHHARTCRPDPAVPQPGPEHAGAVARQGPRELAPPHHGRVRYPQGAMGTRGRKEGEVALHAVRGWRLLPALHNLHGVLYRCLLVQLHALGPCLLLQGNGCQSDRGRVLGGRPTVSSTKDLQFIRAVSDCACRKACRLTHLVTNSLMISTI